MDVVHILGVRFFLGRPEEAVDNITRLRGYVVVPAAPAMVKLRHDAEFRAALTEADFAIADSGFMVLLWRLIRRQKITRISGLAYLKRLIARNEIRTTGATFWVLPTHGAKEKAATWLKQRGFSLTDDHLYVAPRYDLIVEDGALLKLLEQQRPQHIIIGIGGGPQEKLGRYLKIHCSFRPAIHCIGAALGFLTGDQIAIPDWADRLYLGWFFRLVAQPRIFIPRLWSAHELPYLIARYGREMPPLRSRG